MRRRIFNSLFKQEFSEADTGEMWFLFLVPAHMLQYFGQAAEFLKTYWCKPVTIIKSGHNKGVDAALNYLKTTTFSLKV